MKLTDMFDYQVRVRPASLFLCDDVTRFSYSEADARANQIAATLVRLGYLNGARLAVLAQNRVEYILLFLAAAKVGAVLVPLNHRLAPREWEYILQDSGAAGIVADNEYIPALDEMRPRLADLRHRFVFGPPAGSWPSLSALAAECAIADPGVVVESGAALCQLYTSGTTGRPKGVITSHEAMSWQIIQHALLLEPAGVLRGSLLAVAPMYHMAVHFLWMTAASWGGSIRVQRGFDSRETARLLADEQINWVLAVPAMMQACMRDSPELAGRFPHLRAIYYGGSTIDPGLLKGSIDFFGCQFIQVYGLTETLGMTVLDHEDHLRGLTGHPGLLNAAGRPFPGSQVDVVDLDGRSVPPHGQGEILLRGPQVMSRYWNNPAATEEVLVDGWVRTGDAGYLDDHGYLHINDRVKDMIISGGENIYPREIEEVLLSHPNVVEAAVIGVPDDRWGESVKAVVVLDRPDGVAAEELTAHCRDRIARYKTPKSFDVVDALPRNAMGKVLKYQIRERYWEGKKRVV